MEQNVETLEQVKATFLSNRELFARHFVQICNDLLEAFPCQTSLKLSDYYGLDPYMSGRPVVTSDLPPTVEKGSKIWNDAWEVEQIYNARYDYFARQQQVARGTILYLLADDFIQTPQADDFIKNENIGTLHHVTLTPKGHCKLFHDAEERIEKLVSVSSTEHMPSALRFKKEEGGFIDVGAVLKGLGAVAKESIPKIISMSLTHFVEKTLHG